MAETLDNEYRYMNITDRSVYEVFAPLFGNKSCYFDGEYVILGAVDEESLSPVGVIALGIDDYSICIDYIYVASDYRNKGVGTGLLTEVKKLALLTPVPLNVECSFDINNDYLFDFFYSKPEFFMEIKGQTYVINKEVIDDSVFMKSLEGKNIDKDLSISGYEEGCDWVMKIIKAQTKDSSINDFEDIDYDLSQVEIEKKTLKIAVLVKKCTDEAFEIEYAMCASEALRAKFFIMIRNAYMKIIEKTGNGEIKLTFLDDVMDIRKIFPTIEPVSGVCVAKWNYLA